MDPIAEMLIRIKNAQSAGKPTVDVDYSSVKYQIANILVKKDFLEAMERKFKKQKKFLRLILKYVDKEPKMRGVKRISKPGRRVYLPSKKIKSSKGVFGVVIVSTSQGIMSHIDARKKNLGGEIICEVW